MRIAFIALSAPGHLYPTTALARQVQSRNHDVVLISLPDAEPYVSAAGLAFLPYCENAFSAGAGNEIRRQLSKLTRSVSDSRSTGTTPVPPFPR